MCVEAYAPRALPRAWTNLSISSFVWISVTQIRAASPSSGKDDGEVQSAEDAFVQKCFIDLLDRFPGRTEVDDELLEEVGLGERTSGRRPGRRSFSGIEGVLENGLPDVLHALGPPRRDIHRL